MGLGKTYSTKYLLDSNNNSGVAGQVLSTTSTGIDWADANTLPGAGLWLEIGNDIYNSNSGNVGIGTTSPQAKLHVLNSVVGGNYYGQLVVETNGEAAIQLKGTTFSSIYFSDAAAPYQSGVVFNHSTNKLELRGSGNTDDLTITEAGNVGIGTDSPSSFGATYKVLDLYGTNAMYAINTVGGIFGQINAANTDALYIGTRSNHKIHLTTNNSNALTILTNGNVGIGTTTPGEKLEIIGGGANDAVEIRLGTSTSSYRVTSIGQNDGNGAFEFGSYLDTYIVNRWTTNDNGDLILGTNNQEQMRISHSGNVGIGATSPLTAGGSFKGLHIKNATGASLVLSNASYNNYIYSGGSTGELSIEASDSFRVRANGSERMRIISNGNVGIGTTTPNYKLTVSGGINAGGVVTYSKVAGSLDTTGYAIAGLGTAFNGASAGFTFTAYGGTGHYQKVVYSCYGSGTNWVVDKVIDEGTNVFDIAASAASAATIVFTFKTRSGPQGYSPRVVIDATGHSIISTYA